MKVYELQELFNEIQEIKIYDIATEKIIFSGDNEWCPQGDYTIQSIDSCITSASTCITINIDTIEIL